MVEAAAAVCAGRVCIASADTCPPEIVGFVVVIESAALGRRSQRAARSPLAATDLLELEEDM
jgi:hypothetical protein